MHRSVFHKVFKCHGPAILPVIHVLDVVQIKRNIHICITEGAPGVFLINHDFDVEKFLPIIRDVRQNFPALWLGVNFLAVSGEHAFPILADLGRQGCLIDAYWGDDAHIDERTDIQNDADKIASVRRQSNWHGLYFGGTAFKKQRRVDADQYHRAAELASGYMDVVTTSGIATGHAADNKKIEAFRHGCDEHALALASGVTPANAKKYSNDVDAFLVATGINISGDFYNIDAYKLRLLLNVTRTTTDYKNQIDGPRENRSYLSLMAPRTRGEKYAWLDPSSAYINANAFHLMLDDLLEPFSAADIDVVAGFDAAGFVLGGALAARLKTGFLTIRKGGKIPVDYDVVPMTNYSGQTQEMEMRKPAFAANTRVLLVDQWIETGGTMNAGINLVERQGGVVAGIAAICIEENLATDMMRQKYTMSSCVVKGSNIQTQCNQQTLDSFKSFKPEHIFPDRKQS